jgi:putative ABC transport system ATP-binding protein
MPDLDITDLTIEYSSGGYAVRPVDGLDLHASGGALTLLLGPSGCGKTSLLSCLGGILTPKSGSIRFGDIEVSSLKGPALTNYRRTTVGIVFQSFNLVPSLTALENVTVPMRAAGSRWPAAKVRAQELLEGVGLAERVDHRPGDLSGGQQQRVAIARALALDPPLILADEPTAHLDYVQVEEVIQAVRRLASGERVVVVATHDHRLIPLADNVVELVPDMGVSNLPPTGVELAPGEVLFRQGSWGERIYVVEQGEIEIVSERADGTEEVKTVVTAGGYFGEMGPLFGVPRSATARARTRARLMGYTTRDFKAWTAPGTDLAAGQPPPVDTPPVDTPPVDRVPVDTPLVEAAPVETVPVEEVPVAAAPVETAPVAAAPVVAAPVVAAPVARVPVVAAPVDDVEGLWLRPGRDYAATPVGTTSAG